ncbi:dihydropteroate synthase, partial [Streptococcus thoraltensis]
MIVKIGKYELAGKALIIWILNVTPASFSDGGRSDSLDKALQQAEEMIKAGVPVIEVGGETTLPGASFLTAEDEINLDVPILNALQE